MIHIRINKNRKLFLYKNDDRLTNGFDEIEKINKHYLLKSKDKHGFLIESYIYDTSKLQISPKLEIIIYKISNERFYARKGDLYQVYNSFDLNLIFETEKNDEDPYNFSYINDDLYVTNNRIYEKGGIDIFHLNEENILINDGSCYIYCTHLKNKYLFKYGTDYQFIEDNNLEHKLIKKIHYCIKTLYISYDNKTKVFINGNICFNGPIELENYSFANLDIKVFTSNQQFYFVLNKVYGPYNFNYDEGINSMISLIFISINQRVFLFQNNLLIFNYINDELKIVNLNSKYRIKANNNRPNTVARGLESNKLNLMEYTITELIDIENGKVYYFNPFLQNLEVANQMKSILPYIEDSTLYFLNHEFKMCNYKIEIDNIQLIDYSYFKNNFYYILKTMDNYIVKNIDNITEDLFLKNKATFDGNVNVIINTSPDSLNKTDFYTLSENLNKFKKPTFKTYGISNSRNLLNPCSLISFSGMNEISNKQFDLNSNFQFYSTIE